MDEEKTTTEEPESPVKDSDAGSEPKASSLIDDANTAAERMEAANTKKEELLKQEEEIIAKKRMSGQAEAGAVPEKPAKLTDTEYAEALERGKVNPLKEDGFI